MITHRVTWHSAIHRRTDDNTYTHDGTLAECKAIAEHMRQAMIAPVITLDSLTRIAERSAAYGEWLDRIIAEDAPTNGGYGLLILPEGETVGVANDTGKSNSEVTR
jgi:hypothetical protein